MSKSPNYITLEKYIELMNNFVEVKTELVNKREEILESRIENFKNYINLQKEKDAAILEERARFDEVSVKIKETFEHLEKKINESSEHLENKINERIENLEKKVGNMYNLLLDFAKNINNMNDQYANITEQLEKLEKEEKKSIDLPPVVSTQNDAKEQEVFIDDFIDKVKKLNLKEEKEIDKKTIYLKNYKLLIKFSVFSDFILVYDDYGDIYYGVCVRLSIMKGDLDEVIKWPCEEIIEVGVIGRDGERWGGVKFGNDEDKSWRNRVREGDIGEESEKREIIGGTLKNMKIIKFYVVIN